MAFTEYETEQLRKALLKETRRCAVALGMKKTSVDQLTKAVGIAKGSFYKFYESKELLFFAVLEGIHSELYGVADEVLRENGGFPIPATWFSSKMMQSCFCRDCRKTLKMTITMTTKRTSGSFWKNMSLCQSAAPPWLP